jgi:hypothetical protein
MRGFPEPGSTLYLEGEAGGRITIKEIVTGEMVGSSEFQGGKGGKNKISEVPKERIFILEAFSHNW